MQSQFPFIFWLPLMLAFFPHFGQSKPATVPAAKGQQHSVTPAPPAAGPKVSLNQADASTLAAGLKGVGLKKAQAIVAWRNEFGPFTDVSQLREVPGFGESLVNRNMPFLTL